MDPLAQAKPSATMGKLNFYNTSNANIASFASGNTSADYTLTLPAAAPAVNGQFLTGSIAGNLSWTTPAYWGLTGNAGTNAATNFIGATDSVDVIVRTNNTERIRITADGETVLNGHLTVKQSAQPSTSLLNGGNTGNIILANATDAAGKITFNAGNSGTGKAEITINFIKPYQFPPIVVFSANDNLSAKAMGTSDMYVVSTNTNFTIKFNSNASNGSTYNYNYIVVGTR